MNCRRFLLSLAAAPLLFASAQSLAAPPTVEILAMPHPPVKMALAELRGWLAQQGARLKLVETDVESPAGEKKLTAVGLSGHIPIVILIDGQYRIKRKDGSQLDLVNFPAIEGAPPGVRGTWTSADVQAVIRERMKQP